jgi:murein DD-endopeptidase MepM/ murein hydrolase activator NlpD
MTVVAGLLCTTACAAPAWSAAGETAVARDTAGPTVVVLPNTPVGNSASQTAAATVQTPLPAAPSATLAVPTGPVPGEIEQTLQPCADQACAAEAGHLWLSRPIEAGYVDFVERSYPYGSTQGGQREPHHGVEFFNPSGTPVVAAGPGEVIVAGADLADLHGPIPNFYGNLVVIQHDETYAGQPVYTLYGHLRSVEVSVGDRVGAGDHLGVVGSTGVAIGPHLHFEVRVGSNDYASTRNPELWLLPLPFNGRPNGVIAGRVMDRQGNLLPEVTVVIRPLNTESDRPRNRFVQTYSDDPSLNGDDRLQENFAIGDVPRGLYSVSVSTTRFYEQNVTVSAGQVALVTFIVNAPPVVPTSEFTETPLAPTAELSPTIEFSATAEATPLLDMTPTPETPPSETPTLAP